MGGRPKRYDDVEPLLSKESVRIWQGNLKEGPGRKTALYHFARFMRWRRNNRLESDPEVLMRECMEGTNKTLVEHLKQLQEYCKTDPDFDGDRPSTRKRVYRSIRGFYSANFVPLPKAELKVKNDRESSSYVKQDVTAREFLNMVKKILVSVKLSVRDRSVILTALQGGLDDSTLVEVFNIVAYPQLVKAFGTENFREWDASSKCPIRIILNRPKTDYSYYTFQDVDAIDAMKEWLEVREREHGPITIHPPRRAGELPFSDPIYVNQSGRPVRPADVWRVFNDVGKRAGINVQTETPEKTPFKGARTRYPFHSHEVRDVMVTLARGNVDPAIPKFLTGHSIDKLGYDKSPWNNPEHFRSQYAILARPSLNPISGRVLEVQTEVERKFEERLASLERDVRAFALKQAASAP